MSCKLFELLELGGFLQLIVELSMLDNILEDHLDIRFLSALVLHQPVFLQLVTKANPTLHPK